MIEHKCGLAIKITGFVDCAKFNMTRKNISEIGPASVR
jgi:hypothetical protein